MTAISAAPFLLALFCWIALPAQAETLRYLGQQVLPHDYEYQGTTVGGLSGLDYDAATRRFVAISDDRSERQPARFYTLELDLALFNTRAQPGFAGVRFVGVTTLRDEAGKPHAAGTVDPESIRYAGRQAYWWVSEGNAKRGIPPAIEKIGADGKALQRLDIPGYLLPRERSGIRYNLAFESLALADGRLLVGTENALLQDGPAADLEQPSPARILVFDAASGRRLAEHVYLVDPANAPGPFRTNGLVELLAGEGLLLALERSYTFGVGNGARIYRVELDGASDVSNLHALTDRDYRAVRKTLLLDLGMLGIQLDNVEGMSWGPRLSNGKRSLILVSDNNFSPRQITQFLAFEYAD
jgi:hypothetical protein